jgi:hypothetical protein
MAKQQRPPLEMDDLTTNLKQSSGKGIGAFFPSSPPQQEKFTQDAQRTSDSPTPPHNHSEQKQTVEALSSRDDVMTSSRQHVNLRKWRDIIEDTETHNSALRITNDERYDVEDLVSELRRKYKIKTSMNELARLGLLYLITDFKKDKQQSLIIKVKKS